MRRTLTIIAITVALSAAAFGQSSNPRSTPRKSEKELIAISRANVDAAIAKEMVVATDGVTLTPSGPMGVAKVKGRWDSVELEGPVVRIDGDDAVVVGRIVFKGRSSDGHAITDTGNVRIRYTRQKGGWKFINLCLGVCGLASYSVSKTTQC